jgi:hypothetical protein
VVPSVELSAVSGSAEGTSSGHVVLHHRTPMTGPRPALGWVGCPGTHRRRPATPTARTRLFHSRRADPRRSRSPGIRRHRGRPGRLRRNRIDIRRADRAPRRGGPRRRRVCSWLSLLALLGMSRLTRSGLDGAPGVIGPTRRGHRRTRWRRRAQVSAIRTIAVSAISHGHGPWAKTQPASVPCSRAATAMTGSRGSPEAENSCSSYHP